MQERLFEVESVSEESVSRSDRSGLKFRECGEAELWPSSLEEKIPSGHLVRKIARAVSLLDVSDLFRTYAHRGGYPYDPRLLLATVLYGMTNGVRSSRELEEHCKYDLRYRFLMGGHEPDDRTFGRFLVRMEPFLEDVLRQVLLRAKALGQAKGNEIAIDGCRLPGNASWWRYGEAGHPRSDPDARLMYSQGRSVVGYNALVARDTSDGLIVGAQVTSVEVDWHLSVPLVEAMERQQGEFPCAVIGDSGFDSPESIAALEAMGIDTVFAPKEVLNEHLTLNEEGELVCPAGKLIVQRGKPHHRQDGRVTAHFGPVGGCLDCPLKKTCAFKGKHLELGAGADPGAKYRNQCRLRSATYSGAMKRRREVERIFARLRKHDKFERFLRRGLAKVRAEFLLWVIAYDIRELERLLELFVCLLKTVFRAIQRLRGASEARTLALVPLIA